MFLDKDKENALKEVECYHYSNRLAIKAVDEHKYKNAIAHHQNMIRSLEELQRHKNKKQTTDHILKQIESEQQMEYIKSHYGGKQNE